METLAERELQKQQEAATEKRTTLLYTLAGVVCVALLAVVIMWNSGMIQRSATAATVKDTNYTTGSGTVSNGLNVRSEPSADSDIVGTYRTGDSVTITEVDGNWGKTDLGWINLKYVTFD